MEVIIQLIFILSIIKYCLNAALSNNLKVVIGQGALLAIFAFALYPIVINQPLTIIEELLSSRVVVENIALLTTVESIMGILISIYLLNNYFRPKAKRTKWSKFVKIITGVIVLCAVGYFQLLFFKWRVGGEFIITSLLYSGTLFIMVVAISLLLKYLLDSESLKLEVKLLLNLAIMVLGLLVCSSVADYNTSHATAEINWQALIALIFGSLILVLLGIWMQQTNFYNRLKNLLKWNK